MSKGFNFFRQTWANIKRTQQIAKAKEFCVGSDQFGNKYFERLSDPEKGIKRQRRVQPIKEDLFKPPEIPLEWLVASS